jgi:hypothetical protein
MRFTCLGRHWAVFMMETNGCFPKSLSVVIHSRAMMNAEESAENVSIVRETALMSAVHGEKFIAAAMGRGDAPEPSLSRQSADKFINTCREARFCSNQP